MPEFDLERYQDSYQGMASVRRTNERGNPIEPIGDFVHDYDAPVNMAAVHERRQQEKARRARLRDNIRVCMAQMELICPPLEVHRDAT